MPFTFGFYNSSNHDRLYHAEQMSSIFDGIITDGVFQGIGDKLFTTPGTGLQVVVQTGRAWFNHTWSLNDTPYRLAIEPPDSTLSRMDAVVLEVDHNIEVRANTLKIVKGVPASTPKLPSLEPSSGAEKTQHLLATVTVKPGAQSITVQDISIKVGQGDTPFVTSVIQQTDISQLYAAWQAKFEEDLAAWKAEFDEWFKHIQSVLSEEVITNLQRQITENKERFKEYLRIDQKATSAEAIAGVDDTKWISAKIFGLVGKLQGFGIVDVTLTVKTNTGNKIPNLTVPGLYADMECRTYAKTDGTGVAHGYAKTQSGPATLSFSKYMDIVDTSMQITEQPGHIVEKTFTITPRTTNVVTSSGSIKYSENVNTIAITLVGGGYAYALQSRSGYYQSRGDPISGGSFGGDGGKVYTVDSVNFTRVTDCTVTIGAGAKQTGGGSKPLIESNPAKFSVPGDTKVVQGGLNYSSASGTNIVNGGYDSGVGGTNNPWNYDTAVGLDPRQDPTLIDGKEGIMACDGKRYGGTGGQYTGPADAPHGSGKDGGGNASTYGQYDVTLTGVVAKNCKGTDGTGGGAGGFYLSYWPGGGTVAEQTSTFGGSGAFITKMTLKVS